MFWNLILLQLSLNVQYEVVLTYNGLLFKKAICKMHPDTDNMLYVSIKWNTYL